MLLSLFRLTMIVSLLIGAVCIEANTNKLSHEPRDKDEAVAEVKRDDLFANENGVSIARKRQATRNSRMSNDHGSRLHGVHAMDGRVSRAGNENLARKMAKDALKSPKMQETMKKLSRGGDPKKKKLFVSVKVPTSARGSSRLTGSGKQNSHQVEPKGRKKKKRKRHHRRHRKERVGWPGRGSAKYPAIERRATLNRNNRLLGADDSPLHYEPSRIPHDDRNENLAYASSAEGVPEAQRSVENFDVPEPRNNFVVPDPTPPSEEIQRAVVVPRNNEQFDFLGRYDKPLDVADPRTVFQSVDAVPEVPQVPRKLSALDLQNFNNYQQCVTSLQHMNNIDQNVYSQSQLGTIPNANENIAHSPMSLNDYNLQSVPVQDISNNLPAVNMPNAIEQPLGKVLESLGINVHADSSNSMYQNNVPDNINVTPLSHFEPHDQPVDHALTNPSCDKESPTDDTEHTSNGKDGNIKIRGHQRRRQLSENGLQSSNLFSLVEGEKNTNISNTVHDTKEIASQLLGTIMEELEELKLNGSRNNKNEGSWSTAQAGVKLDMKVVNRSIIVTLSNITSPRFHESLLNGTWNVSGYAPFKRGSPFTLTATDNTTNSVAVFVGACRVCQGIETIAGVWSVARSPKDCGDFQVATSVFNDIFRKSKLSSLKGTRNATVSKNATAAEHKKKRS